MTRLYFVGCSHTYGDDLVDPLNQGWPARIASVTNSEFFNDAISGGTNDRSVYRVIKHIDQYDKFYIAWTYTNRFTLYRRDNNHEVPYNVAMHNTLYGASPEYVDFGNMYYQVYQNELFAFKLWLQQIILLQHYLSCKSKQYIMVNAAHNFIHVWTSDWKNFNTLVAPLLCFDSMNDEQLYAEYLEISNLVKQIDFTYFVGWNNFTIRGLARQFPVGQTKHLLSEGHQAVADYIIAHDTN